MKKKIKPKLHKFEVEHPLEELVIIRGICPITALKSYVYG
jgi:hypothetical protein